MQSTSASEKRMADLVHQHRAEQEQGRNDPENPVDQFQGQAFEIGEVALSERPGNQDKSEQPRIVDTDLDTRERAEPSIRLLHHSSSLALSTNIFIV